MKPVYKSMYFKFIAIAGVALIAACGGSNTTVRNIPMITEAVGEGPWPVVTYDDVSVMKESVQLDGSKFQARSEMVYINKKSQFVLRDGSPIRDFSGRYMYWNDQGLIINMELQVIPENIAFSADGKPLPVGTPLKLKGYSQPSALAKIEVQSQELKM